MLGKTSITPSQAGGLVAGKTKKEEKKMGAEKYRVNVYDSHEKATIVARVNYNQELDMWDGRNWGNGGIGRHLGITRLRDGVGGKVGQYVLIYGTQWQGERDYAVVVSPMAALQAILRSGNVELLELRRFAELKALAEREGITGDTEAADDEW